MASLVLCGALSTHGFQALGSASDDTAKGGVLFEKKCKTIAGEKIYRTVPNVEGLMLVKLRPMASDREWRDPMWPGAAFAHESAGGPEGYIKTFLKYEDYVTEPSGKRVANKIGLTTEKTDRPGYRYIDAMDEKGGRVRYTAAIRDVEIRPSILIGGDGKPHMVKSWVLDRSTPTGAPPRYGVTYEDHVIPEDRALGIASSTVKVIDMETMEVVGEMTRYAWRRSGPSHENPSPWLTAYKCGGHSDFQATRFFVDQVLLPKPEDTPDKRVAVPAKR